MCKPFVSWCSWMLKKLDRGRKIKNKSKKERKMERQEQIDRKNNLKEKEKIGGRAAKKYIAASDLAMQHQFSVRDIQHL